MSPTVARWELYERLRRKRADLGLVGAKFARALGYASNYGYRLEGEKMVLPEEKLLVLLDLLEVDGEERDKLIELRSQAKERGWWDEYAGLFTPDQTRLWGLEAGAEEISLFDTVLVPGLLQTEDYARSLISGDQAMIRRPEVRRRVQARMQRQQRIGGEDPIRLNAVISEAALHQQIGGIDVLRAQLEHLVKVITTYDTIEIHILPFTSATGAGTGGSTYHILDFPGDQAAPLAWHESAILAEVVEDPTKIEILAATFGSAAQASLSREDSLTRINDAITQIGSSS